MEKDRLSQIDEERVRELAGRLDSSRAKKSDYERRLGQIQGRIDETEEKLKQLRETVNQAEREEELSNALRRRYDVAKRFACANYRYP